MVMKKKHNKKLQYMLVSNLDPRKQPSFLLKSMSELQSETSKLQISESNLNFRNFNKEDAFVDVLIRKTFHSELQTDIQAWRQNITVEKNSLENARFYE